MILKDALLGSFFSEDVCPFTQYPKKKHNLLPLFDYIIDKWASQVALMIKNLPAMQETPVPSLG